MRRREFVAGLSMLTPWPLTALAQQGVQLPRLGVLKATAARGPLEDGQFQVFAAALAELGWRDGRNIRIDYRTTGIDAAQKENAERFARELVSLKPDVILAHTTMVVAALQRQTTTIPIVFVSVADPVGSGLVASLARPGGNITGFANYEPSSVAKLIEILTEIVPHLSLASKLFHVGAPILPTDAAAQMDAAARSHSIKLVDAPIEAEADIERVISELGGHPNVGMVVLPDPFLGQRRDLIISLAARHGVPAIYPFRFFVEDGGLISYGNDLVEEFRQAPAYVDRILKGASPTDLPVQLPTKYELAINLKTAKALNLTVPLTLLAGADKVIE